MTDQYLKDIAAAHQRKAKEYREQAAGWEATALKCRRKADLEDFVAEYILKAGAS